MSELSFKPYRHGVSTYATRITDQEWHNYRQLLTDLHQHRLSRPAMLNELVRNGFRPSLKQLNTQMRKWNLTAQGPSTDTTVVHSSTTLNDELSVSDCIFVNLDEMGEQKFMSEEEPLELLHPPCDVDESLPVLNHQLDSLSVTLSGDSQATTEECSFTTTLHRKDDKLRVRLQSLARKLQLFRNDPANSTIEVASECCCLDFFYGIGCFTKAKSLYLACLESCKSPMSLHFILMLVNYLNTCGNDHIDLRVQNMIHQSFNEYLTLATRADIKNIVVDSVIHELSDLCHNFTDSGIEFPDVESMPTNFIRWGELISPQMCPTSEDLSNLDHPSLPSYVTDAGSLSDMKEEHIRSILERCRTVLLGERYKIVAVLFWNSGPAMSNGDHSVTLEQSTLVKLASHVTLYLSKDFSRNPDFYMFDQACLSSQQLIILLEAIGVLVMIRLGSILQRDGGHSYGSFLDHVSCAFHSSIVELLPSESDPLFIQTNSIRNTSLELRRLSWIYGLDDADAHRSNLHAGKCHFKALWTSLRKDIRDFDQERTWPEKQIFLHEERTDQRRGLCGDNESMSVNTSSTDSTFMRFRASAWNLASLKKQNAAGSQHSALTSPDKFGFVCGSDVDDTTSRSNTKADYEDKGQAESDLMPKRIENPCTFIGGNRDRKVLDDESELLFVIGSGSQF